MSDAEFGFPTPPDPVRVEQWAGQVRTLIALLAGAGLVGGAWAGVSAQQIANVLTALLTLAGIAGAAWSSIKSWRQKSAARAVTVASANASAQLGQPVTVAVTPAGLPNVVSKIAVAEIAAAPADPAQCRAEPSTGRASVTVKPA